MRAKKRFIGLRAAVAILTLGLFATSTWASDERVLHSFGNGTDGVEPAGRPDHGCRRQPLRHDHLWRHSQQLARDGVRVVAQRRRRLDGEGVAQLRTAQTGLAPRPA